MNPRVSRSSALASKATGFPIAKIAAKLAIGYTLDEIPNDITGETPAAFEPTLDYVVVKVPRFAFEKFPGADPELTTTMKCVGEAMALGRNVRRGAGQGAALAWRDGRGGFWVTPDPARARSTPRCPTTGGSTPSSGRCATGASVGGPGASAPGSTRGSSTRSRRWSSCARRSRTRRCSTSRCCAGPSGPGSPTASSPRCGRSSPARTGCAPCGTGSASGRSTRPSTPAPPSSPRTHAVPLQRLRDRPDAETEIAPQTERPKVLILGSGPNRIGQGIEFDYSCVHAVMALREAGFETVMVNCNPETVSTDYDTADRLYFEPLTFEDVLEVVHAEQESGTGRRGDRAARRPDAARARAAAHGRRGPGGRAPPRRRSTSPRTAARSARCCGRPACRRPRSAPRPRSTTRKAIAARIGYPVLVRPSYVLGGRGMEIVYDDATLAGYIARATAISPERPVLVDRFLDDADRDRRRRAVRRPRGVSSAA